MCVCDGGDGGGGGGGGGTSDGVCSITASVRSSFLFVFLEESIYSMRRACKRGGEGGSTNRLGLGLS